LINLLRSFHEKQEVLVEDNVKQQSQDWI